MPGEPHEEPPEPPTLRSLSTTPPSRRLMPSGARLARQLSGSVCTGSGVGRAAARKLYRGEPVDHAVVHLSNEPDPPIVQTIGDPDLPQRPPVHQRRGHRCIDRIAPSRWRRAAHMPADIEVRVVDPHGICQPERDRHKFLAIPGRSPRDS